MPDFEFGVEDTRLLTKLAEGGNPLAAAALDDVDEAKMLVELAAKDGLSLEAYLTQKDEWGLSLQDCAAWLGLTWPPDARAIAIDEERRAIDEERRIADNQRLAEPDVCIRCDQAGATERVGDGWQVAWLAHPECAKHYVPYWMYGDWRARERWREPELLDEFYARVSLRDTTIVYRCYDDADRLLYVGQTQRPWGRGGWLPLAVDHAGRAWPGLAHRVTYEVFPSRRAALQAERDAIRNENPVENRQRYEKTPIAPEPKIAWDEVHAKIRSRMNQQLNALERALELSGETGGGDVDELLDELATSADQHCSVGGGERGILVELLQRTGRRDGWASPRGDGSVSSAGRGPHWRERAELSRTHPFSGALLEMLSPPPHRTGRQPAHRERALLLASSGFVPRGVPRSRVQP